MNDVAFLLDVDNTLIDNDRVKTDLEAHIEQLVGVERAALFWSAYEEVRRERDYVDFPHTLGRFRSAFPDERKFPQLAALVLCYPYDACLYPGALEAVVQLRTIGTVAILSDGDPVFQPAKIARAGLADAADEVLIFAHKEEHLDEVRRRIPADRYVLVDDKPRILSAAKERMGDRLLTLHVCQGKYAHADEHHDYPAADLQMEAIAELLALSLKDLRGTVTSRRRGR